jgi:sugar transferase EpsL
MDIHSLAPYLYRHLFKRIFDVVGGMTILFLIWPFLIVIFLILMLTIGSPVIFRQKRPGFMGKPFIMYKFRTMTDLRDENGCLLPDDQRITKIGHLLRSLSLDELPEIFNVLKGELSLVGPRPLLMQYLDRYTPEQARRHEAIPGITGWAQINGRNALAWDDKFSLDVWYVDNLSFILDIQILVATIGKVLRREGISQEGFVSAEEFKGQQYESSSNDK